MFCLFFFIRFSGINDTIYGVVVERIVSRFFTGFFFVYIDVDLDLA